MHSPRPIPESSPWLSNGAMKTIEEIRRDRVAWLVQRYGGVTKLANALDKSPSQVSQVLNAVPHSRSGKPRVLGSDQAREYEGKLGLPEGIMDTPAEGVDAIEIPLHGQAQSVSLSGLKVASQVVEWSSLMRGTLPAAFKVAAPDDSMAPRLRTGQLVEFETGREPRPGDGVLVADNEEKPYIRLYVEGRQGQWEAHALKEGYRPLESDRDGLKLLAVLVAVHARWG